MTGAKKARKKPEELIVYVGDERIGILRKRDVTGIITYKYEPSASRPLSLSMPVREQLYGQVDCMHYFEGLLPEGSKARAAIAKRHGVRAGSPFELLQAIGFECAGAVSLRKEGEVYDLDVEETVLDEETLRDLIRDLPFHPLFAGVKGVRISLAGVQDKAAIIVREDGTFVLPQGKPSTHILKPAIAEFRESALNEYLTMDLASKVGVDAPSVQYRRAGDIDYILAKRFDRFISESGEIERVHQEDFCQALGYYPADKYEDSGGPDFIKSFKLLDRTTIPALEKVKFLDQIVFNYLVGNVDAHGKNFSLLHHSSVRIELAPLYDCLCLTLYQKHSTEMAMKIGDTFELTEVTKADWELFSEAVEVKYQFVKSTIAKLSFKILAHLENWKPSSKFEDEWAAQLKKQCIDARRRLDL